MRDRLGGVESEVRRRPVPSERLSLWRPRAEAHEGRHEVAGLLESCIGSPEATASMKSARLGWHLEPGQPPGAAAHLREQLGAGLRALNGALELDERALFVFVDLRRALPLRRCRRRLRPCGGSKRR